MTFLPKCSRYRMRLNLWRLTLHTDRIFGELGYPGLAYVRTRLTRKNPAEVLLTALIRQLRESRGGSPSMVALQYWAEGIYLVIGPSEKTQSPESFGVCCQSCETGVRERSSKRSQNPSASRTRSKTRRKPLGQRSFFLQATRTPGERHNCKRQSNVVYWSDPERHLSLSE